MLDLTVSNPTRAGLAYDQAGILAAFCDERMLEYEPLPFGLQSARAAISRELLGGGVTVDPERVVVTASSSESYGYLFKLLCDPGDEVLVPVPSYPLFEHLARFEGVTPVAYPLGFDGAWFIDFERLLEKQSSRTRAIVVVTPNNPTGHYLTRAELERLAALGLPIIGDEVFAPYPISRPTSAVGSVLERDDVLTFALSGLSKLCGLPQLKLGWIAVNGPKKLVHSALTRLELICDSFLSPNQASLVALPELLRLGALTRAQILARLAENVGCLTSHTQHAAFSALPVEGGWSAVLRLPRTRSEEAWALGLLSDAQVLVQPGYFYDFEDEPYAVLSLLTPQGEFADGLGRLRDYVAGG